MPCRCKCNECNHCYVEPLECLQANTSGCFFSHVQYVSGQVISIRSVGQFTSPIDSATWLFDPDTISAYHGISNNLLSLRSVLPLSLLREPVIKLIEALRCRNGTSSSWGPGQILERWTFAQPWRGWASGCRPATQLKEDG